MSVTETPYRWAHEEGPTMNLDMRDNCPRCCAQVPQLHPDVLACPFCHVLAVRTYGAWLYFKLEGPT